MQAVGHGGNLRGCRDLTSGHQICRCEKSPVAKDPGPRPTLAVDYSASSFFRAAARSLSFSGPTFGWCKSSLDSVSITAAATTSQVNHLLSAGTTYQGASGVAVWRIMSSYACWYSFQNPRS